MLDVSGHAHAPPDSQLRSPARLRHDIKAALA